MKRAILMLALAGAVWAAPQDIRFPAGFEKLAEKADEVVTISLDADMLGLAANFLSNGEGDQKKLKEIVKGLKGIYIRSFEFSREGQYPMEIVEEIEDQLKAPEWAPVISVRSKKKGGDNARIYFRRENGKISGITIVSAEPKQLTVVHIVGLLEPEDVARLGGNFGIPDMSWGPGEGEGEK